MAKNKEIVLSGIRPTGELHFGNYFGAFKKWLEIQDQYRCFWMVADLHSLTTLENTKDLKKTAYEMTALWLALGLDPEKSTIFLQSGVAEHGELNAIFSTLLPVAMLELNPTYKEMTASHPKAGSFGLLNYPVLQAADILLYKTSKVPVGKDQEPHIEITREIARRFNRRFGRLFPEPQAIFEKIPKIYSLADPAKKMSKSHRPDSYIALLDQPAEIRRKIRAAVTDSGQEIIYNPVKKPAISNLLNLYHLVSGGQIKKIEEKFKNKGYAEFKKDLAEKIIKFLAPIQKRFEQIIKNPKKIEAVLKNGSEKAGREAQKTMKEVKNKIGLINLN
ncbi:MAG: tryptophan--tRNA ligase [Patescibacteria group bacterium]